MKVTINVEKEHFYFLVVLASILLVVGVNAFGGAPPSFIGHSDSEIESVSANKIIPGAFGTGDYIFPGTLNASSIVLGNVERTTWPKETFNLPASNISSGTFGLNTGNGNYVFPADAEITNKLTVKGITNTSGGLVIEVRTANPPASELYTGRIWLIK